jgi:hypothetical protein
MAISRAERRAERRARFEAAFGRDAERALDLMELVEYAWHDCYSEITPPPEMVEDIVISAEGSLTKLISAARLAVIDSRDLRMLADDIRDGRGSRRG